MFSKRSRILAGGTLAVAAVAVLAGCNENSKVAQPYNDTAVAGRASNAMVVGNGADGFSNWGMKCDGYGHLVYVIFHGDSPYGAITVIPDKRCGSLTTPIPGQGVATP